MKNLPKKIICLTEETTEFLYLLGEQNRISGISVYTVRPEIARTEKQKVSAFISGNINKIKSLSPDLVIGFSDIQADLARDLIKEGLNVIIFNQRSVEEIFYFLIIIGRIVGKEKESMNWIETWKNKIERFQLENENNKRPRVFFQEWENPIITSILWVSELIEICGGENCFKDKAEAKMAKDRIITLEEVIAKDPEIIIGSWCGKPVDFDWVKNHLGETSAVKNNKIYEIDSSIILQPGPALFLEGMDKLKEQISSVN